MRDLKICVQSTFFQSQIRQTCMSKNDLIVQWHSQNFHNLIYCLLSYIVFVHLIIIMYIIFIVQQQTTLTTFSVFTGHFSWVPSKQCNHNTAGILTWFNHCRLQFFLNLLKHIFWNTLAVLKPFRAVTTSFCTEQHNTSSVLKKQSLKTLFLCVKSEQLPANQHPFIITVSQGNQMFKKTVPK